VCNGDNEYEITLRNPVLQNMIKVIPWILRPMPCAMILLSAA
jgi:hypothetical protein